MARDCRTVSYIFFADDSMLFSQANESAARNIHILLQEYCVASSQKINYHKYFVFFSPNISSELKNKIIDILGILESSGKGKYLGLHANMGKNKSEVFSLILEKVLRKMQV